MRWVLHGALTSAVAEALARHGDSAQSEAEVDLPVEARPHELLKAAQSRQLDLMTADAGLVHAIFQERIAFNRVIVYLELPGEDVEQDDAIDRLYKRYKRLTPGRLYTVTASRVKVRQLPGRGLNS